MENPLLGRSRSGVGIGVGVEIFRPESELESESLKVRRLRSPAYKVLTPESNIALCLLGFYVPGMLPVANTGKGEAKSGIPIAVTASYWMDGNLFTIIGQYGVILNASNT